MEGVAELGIRDLVGLLRARTTLVLATIGADGAPHQVPVVFTTNDPEAHRVQGRSLALRIWFPIDGKPKRHANLQRLRNTDRDPRVSLLADHYHADWHRLWWVRMEGIAGRVEDEAERVRVLKSLRGRYPQYQPPDGSAVLPEDASIVGITIKSVQAWCAGRWDAHLN